MITQKMDAFKARLNILAGDELLVKLARGGLAALLIKIGAAGLSFLMFLALARAMTPEDFGRFGFAFSLATILAVTGSFGQRALVMRFASIYHQEGNQSLLRGVIRSGYRLVILGCGTLGVATACFGWFWPGLEHRTYYLATGVFILILGLAEYQAHLLRAFGGMTLALLPRDILWRAGVIIFAGLSTFGILPLFNIEKSIWLITAILAGVTLGQALFHPATHPKAMMQKDVTYKTGLWRKASLGLWGTSVVRMAVPNLSVVIIGLMLTADQAGSYFAALRIAMLINLILMASNLVAAPLISQNWNRKDFKGLNKIIKTIAFAVTASSIPFMILFIFAGEELLHLFGDGFEIAHTELIILSVGYLINILAGSTMQFMEMTGYERPYLRIIIFVNTLGVLSMAPAIYFFGVTGAAVVTSGSLAAWNVGCIVFLKRKIGIDPSVLTLFFTKK